MRDPPHRPLHEVLRQSASSKNLSRAQLTEKIKQQVHLNAVQNYQAPSLAVLQQQLALSLSLSSEANNRPIKSILKKKTAGGGVTTHGKKKVARVNYAFEKEI